MLSEILAERAEHLHVGKWHLCPTVEMNVASTGGTGRAAAGSSAGTGSSRGDQPVVPDWSTTTTGGPAESPRRATT